MKNLLSLIIVVFVFNIVTAQSQPTPPAHPNSSSTITSSSSKTEKHVSISIDRDLKLKLNIDDDAFEMKLTYPKKFNKDFQYAFSKNFTALQSINEWNGTDKSTRVKMHRNKIEVLFIKAAISEIEMNKIKTFAEDVLEQLEWDVEDLELWEFSGEWSLGNRCEQQ
jgi:hypothetical protein